MKRYLISTLSKKKYPFEKMEEFSEQGESLEVRIEGLESATIRSGATIWERFLDFLPFDHYDPHLTLGEGETPLVSSKSLGAYVGLDSILLKNETLNPTWSFKDRGSLPCIMMAKEEKEKCILTISTGNMGASIAAYAARAHLHAIIFIPSNCPKEKIRSMSVHGAVVIQVETQDFGEMKRKVMHIADTLKLRIVSGNGPIRVEGYKFCAFELYEQLKGNVPDFIAVPTSACGHIRGLFKGFRELLEAKLTDKLPRMIVVQAEKNSPIVTAFKQNQPKPIPFSNVDTIARAMTTGNPAGGDEILNKAYHYHWLAEHVSEEEILMGQRALGRAGFFVEPSSATSLSAVKKLCAAGHIKPHQSVVLMLTGSGLKDSEGIESHTHSIRHSTNLTLEADLKQILDELRS